MTDLRLLRGDLMAALDKGDDTCVYDAARIYCAEYLIQSLSAEICEKRFDERAD